MLSARIKEAAQRLGFALVGISPVKITPHEEFFAQWLRKGLGGEMGYLKRTEELRRDPTKLVPWAVSVVSVGLNYYAPMPRPTTQDGAKGWISRYAWGDDYHDVVKDRLESLLEKIGEIYPGVVEGKAFVDSGPVLERDIAGVAGIGWIGKNTHLISPRRGSWFFLGELFLSIELAYDRPIRDRCGRCDLCLKACPTAAFVGPYILDARRCISYLTIELKGWMPRHLRPLVGNHIFGCDICQDVCPWNRRARPTSEPALRARSGMSRPDLQELLRLDAAKGEQVAAVDLPAAALLDALTAGVAAGILTDAAPPLGRVTFRHALRREALLEELPSARRAALHRAAADHEDEVGVQDLRHRDVVVAFDRRLVGGVDRRNGGNVDRRFAGRIGGARRARRCR